MRAANPSPIDSFGQRKYLLTSCEYPSFTLKEAIAVISPTRRRHRPSPLLCLVCAFAAPLLLGCSPQDYVRQADKEVYRVIADKQKRVLGEERPFRIHDPIVDRDDAPDDARADAHEHAASQPAVRTPSENDTDQTVLSLADAMLIAFINNRDYETRKESLYSEALALTGERDAFATTWNSLFESSGERTAGDTTGGVGHTGGFTRLLANGARFSLGLTTALSQFFTGDPRRAASSALAVSFVQPLMRNAGKLVAQENLTQAERDVIYELRSFARFQQTFAVAVASEYFRVLEQERRVENERLNYEFLQASTKRIEAFAENDIVPQLQVDQARQSELSARNRWITAVENYQNALDSFKITMGIATSAPVLLDSAQLDRLAQGGLVHPELDLPDSIETALAERYDLMTSHDRIADRRRRLAIARKQLDGEVKLSLSANAGTPAGKVIALDLDNEGRYQVGLEVDLPLERTAERNAYRAAMISLDQARRAYSLDTDRIKLAVRESYRRLQRARESYRIEEMSVKLAEQRVDSTSMLLKDGRAETRDLLDAQRDLVNAQNAVASALVTHTITRLEFFRDIGTLDVDESAPVEALDPKNAQPDKENVSQEETPNDGKE